MIIMRQNRHRKVGERKKNQQRKGYNRFFNSLPVAALPWFGALCGKHRDCVGKTRQENSVALSALLREFLNSPQTHPSLYQHSSLTPASLNCSEWAIMG